MEFFSHRVVRGEAGMGRGIAEGRGRGVRFERDLGCLALAGHSPSHVNWAILALMLLGLQQNNALVIILLKIEH